MANGKGYIQAPYQNRAHHDGFPEYVQENINDTIEQAAWFAYDGMWRALASGIGKGIAAAIGTVMVASAVIGGLATGASVAEGVGIGLNTGLGILTSSAYLIPILAIGAAVGAVYDVSVKHNRIQKELAEIRKEKRDLKGVQQEFELDQDPNRVPGVGIEKPTQYYKHSHEHEHEVTPEQVATDHWQRSVSAERNAPGTRGVS